MPVLRTAGVIQQMALGRQTQLAHHWLAVPNNVANATEPIPNGPLVSRRPTLTVVIGHYRQIRNVHLTITVNIGGGIAAAPA